MFCQSPAVAEQEPDDVKMGEPPPDLVDDDDLGDEPLLPGDKVQLMEEDAELSDFVVSLLLLHCLSVRVMSIIIICL